MVRVSFVAATMAVAAFLAFSAEETAAAPHLLKTHSTKKNFNKKHFLKQGVRVPDGFSVVGLEGRLSGGVEGGLGGGFEGGLGGGVEGGLGGGFEGGLGGGFEGGLGGGFEGGIGGGFEGGLGGGFEGGLGGGFEGGLGGGFEGGLGGKLNFGLPRSTHKLREGGRDHSGFSNHFLGTGLLSSGGYQPLSGYSPLQATSINRLALPLSWQRFIHLFPTQFALDAYFQRNHAPSFSHSASHLFIFSGPQESVNRFSDPNLFHEGLSADDVPSYNLTTSDVKGETFSEPKESVVSIPAPEFSDKSLSTSGVPNFSLPSLEIRAPSVAQQQGPTVGFAAPEFSEGSNTTNEVPIYHRSASKLSAQIISEPHLSGLGISTSLSDPENSDHIFLVSEPRQSVGSIPVLDNSEQSNLPSPLPVLSTSGVTFLPPQSESNLSYRVPVSSPVIHSISNQNVSFQEMESAHSTPAILDTSQAIDPSPLFIGDFIPGTASQPNSDYASQLQTVLGSFGPLPLEPHT